MRGANVSLVTEMIQRAANALYRKRANEIEDIVAGLMASGVSKDEIEIREYPAAVTRVAVRGVERYEITTTFSIKNAIFGDDE